MIEKSSTLYKIIILYMLEKVNFPLSNNQITNFFLDHGYTSYFHVQQTLNDLLESRLMEVKKQGSRTCYQATEEGRTTLSYFEKKISDEIRQEIDTYLKENDYEMRNTNSRQCSSNNVLSHGQTPRTWYRYRYHYLAK